MLLTEKTQILTRWAEHIQRVLNQPSTISNAAIDHLLEVEINTDLDLPPSLQETIRAVQQLSSGKATGSDAIPAEIYKHGGPQLMNRLTVLFQEMRQQGQVSQDFKDATIVHRYKKKGNRQLCDNHRRISLLNIAGKIFARILFIRLNAHLEQGLLRESQCGFRRQGTAPLLSSDGRTLLTEKSQILKRWAEHFRSVLNCSSAISDVLIDQLPKVDTNNDLDLPPSLPETIQEMQQISSGKAPGSDAIPPEVYMYEGPRLMAELTTLFQDIWRHGQVPQVLKDTTIVHLYKRKGNRRLCDNHRGIAVLNIGGKIFTCILLNRLNGHLEQGLLPESQ
ncbi:unnamed protein product [Schistocephalus solidus]|uniref:Reverse transcriptase domain-containing protein n=1 Tax=Schistocephalus solidus TaxID=70667 RepID=A0A183SA96_SCHSO|nr:unnamed protein product [Schistocephalus solidus]